MTNFGLVYSMILIIVCVILPFLAIRNSAELVALLKEKPEMKTSFYVQGIIVQWILTAMILFSMIYKGHELTLLGWPRGKEFFGLVLIALLVVSSILFYYFYNLGKRMAQIISSLYSHVSHYMPTTDSAYKWGIVLSITAGICEELIYRGFLYWQFSSIMNQWLAIILLNIVFAFAHYSTGILNAVLSFVLGFVFSVIYLMTGDLLWPMLLHVLIDLLAITIYPKAQYSLEKGVNV